MAETLTLERVEEIRAGWLNLMHLTCMVSLNFYKNHGTRELAEYIGRTTGDPVLRELCAKFVREVARNPPDVNYRTWRGISDHCRDRVHACNERVQRMTAAQAAGQVAA